MKIFEVSFQEVFLMIVKGIQKIVQKIFICWDLLFMKPTWQLSFILRAITGGETGKITH